MAAVDNTQAGQVVPSGQPAVKEAAEALSCNEDKPCDDEVAMMFPAPNAETLYVDDKRILPDEYVKQVNRSQWEYLVQTGRLEPARLTKEDANDALHQWLETMNNDTSYTKEDLVGLEILKIKDQTATSEIIEKRWSVVRKLDEFKIDQDFPIPFMDHERPAVAYEASTVVCPRCGPDMRGEVIPMCPVCSNHRTVWIIKLATHDRESFIEDKVLNRDADSREQEETKAFIGNEIAHEPLVILQQKLLAHYAVDQFVDMRTTISMTSYHRVHARLTDGEETAFILFGDEKEQYVLPDP